MKIGICTSVDHAAAMTAAGFDFFEENVQAFFVPEEADDVFAPKLKAAQAAPLPLLAANCFLPGGLKCTGPEFDLERIARYAGTAFRRARQVGLRYIVFGSGGSRQIPEGFDRVHALAQFLTCLRRIAPLAEEQGVTIAIEPLGRKECNFLHTLAEGAAIVEEVNHPHVRLLADIYHMRCNDETPDAILAQGRWIQHVHVAELEGRLAPGLGGEDFGPWLGALKKIGYTGAISFECGWKQFPEQAAGSLKSFREQARLAGLDA